MMQLGDELRKLMSIHLCHKLGSLFSVREVSCLLRKLAPHCC